MRNGMPYLTETLASIEAQTYRHFTVLAWDDASTDSTLRELRRWIPSRLPGRIISRSGGGLGAMLARMVLEADTDLCARIDADDINEPHRLERQINYLDRCPNLGVLGSQVLKIDSYGHEHGQHYSLPNSFDDILHRMLHAWVMWHPAVIFRRKVVLEAGNYRNYPQTLIEDYDLWLRVARISRLENLGDILVKYRVMQSSATEKAIKSGRLIPAMDQCFSDNSLKTFDISPEVAMQLRQRAHPSAIKVLVPTLRHLSKVHGGSVLGRLKSRSFRESLLSLRNPYDEISKIAVDLVDSNPEIKKIALKASVKFLKSQIKKYIQGKIEFKY